MRMTILAAAAVATVAVAGLSAPPPAHADMFSSTANNQCLANQGGVAALQVCSASRHNNAINYSAGDNSFYGPLNQAGQCLDVQNGRVLFAACNGSKSQVWKLAGATGQLNNEMGQCIAAAGSGVAVRGCPANGTWANESFIRVQALANVPRGTVLGSRGNDITNAATGAVVAPGALAALKASAPGIVSHDGGGLIGNDGAGLIAAGGGNVVMGRGAAGLIAAGGGN